MKKKFLEAVAEDIINKYGTNLAHIAVVFPNKRASLFLNEYLARMADKPMWSPAYITISELFRQNSELVCANQIKLICDLHKVFCSVTGIDEPLDHFYGWGQLLLSDFDDIDKNLADADKVFANMRDIHELDDVSYLTEEQKVILSKFFANFSVDHNSILKQRFLQLWSHFGDIYHTFNDTLAAQGLAYEGALYRKVAEEKKVAFQYDTYLFVGFNVLQKVEQQIFRKLKSEGKAKFYWDFDTYYKNNERQEAGHYIRQHLAMFNNELDFADNEELYTQFKTNKEITYISAQTNDVQARFVATWLRENKRYADGRNTAIVLADEHLLPSVINNLPEEVEKVNITTGYPLNLSPFNSFVSILINLQTAGMDKSHTRYKLKYVFKILRHPYAKYISDKVFDVIQDLSEHKQFYPTRSFLAQDEGLSLLFSDIEAYMQEKENYCFSSALMTWTTNILQYIGRRVGSVEDALFAESLFRTYTLLNNIRELIDNGDLDTDVTTLQRLISQVFSTTSIPFHGEPACGIQIMGVLETRNLDFEHVLVLSCNDGNLPKGVSDSSFIPYAIRKAYGLTTIDNKVAIYAYYFYRLLQRSSDATLAYNSATEDGKTGEMSRFMLQMLVESGHKIKKQALQTQQQTVPKTKTTIEKDNTIMEVLNSKEVLSPTAINKYIRCKLLFYYNQVAGIKEPDIVDEDNVDNRVFGNIFHLAAKILYDRIMDNNNVVRKSSIEELLKHDEQIEMAVDKAFKEELFKMKDTTQKPEYNGLQLINREVIISYLKQLLQIDSRLGEFKILGLEEKAYDNISIIKFPCDLPNQTPQASSLKIGGIIDRFDMVKDEEGMVRIRVVDYKTGHKPTQQVNSVEEIFSGEKIREKHTDYFLQAFLYSIIIRHSKKFNEKSIPVSPALLFIQHAGADDYTPILSIEQEEIKDVEVYGKEFKERLTSIVNEIFDPKVPFSPTEDSSRCTYCPYYRLCNM